MTNIDDFLGPAAGDLDDDTKTELAAALAAVDIRYAGTDEISERANAYSGAAQVALGDETMESLVDQWRAARAAERERMEVLTGALIYASRTESENHLSVRLDLNRQTVRKALGK